MVYNINCKYDLKVKGIFKSEIILKNKKLIKDFSPIGLIFDNGIMVNCKDIIDIKIV